MAEVTLVKEQLTSGMIDAGAALLRKLDDVGMAPTAAFWLFDAEINEWRLVLASPEVATLGPLAVYLKIGTAIRELPPTPTSVSLSSVVVMESDAELVRLLTVGLERHGGTDPIRFTRSAIDGHYIDDALVYPVTLNGQH